jgi:hypothetical protein
MNKRTIAVITGAILMQSAAFAADTTNSKSTDTTSVVGKEKKKGFSIGRAIAHVFGAKDKEASQSVATAEAANGAY